MASVLIVDDDATTVASLAELVAAEGFEVATADSLAAARAALLRQRPDVVLCDLLLPDGQGIDLRARWCQEFPISTGTSC